MKLILFLGLMTGLIMILSWNHFASAQPILLSLERSDSCKKSTACIPFKDLIPLDTSDQRVSGKLYDDHRAKPLYKNHHAFYQFKKDLYVVCVECGGTFQEHSRKITIEVLKNFKYIKQSDNRIINNTFYDYSDRHIENCKTATVSANLDLIKDTIYVMGNNCKVESKFKEQNKTVKPATDLRICSYYCEYQKFMKDAKSKAGIFLIQPDIKLKNQNGTVKVNG